jgi:hypothetical protein
MNQSNKNKNAEILKDIKKLLIDLKTNVNDMKVDVSKLKHDIFVVRTIHEVKKDTVKTQEKNSSESGSWFW